MATVYISPTGSDSNTYAQAQSSSTPWATMSKVEASATTGDTVVMLNGTYTLTAEISFTKSFTWTAQTNGSAIINSASAYYYLRFDSTTQSFTGCVFIGFAIPGTSQPYGQFGLTNGTLSLTNCTFRNSTIGDAGATSMDYFYGGLIRASGAATINLTNCLIYAISRTTSASTKATLIGSRGSTVNIIGTTIYLPSTSYPIACLLGSDGGGATTLTMKNTVIKSDQSTVALTTTQGGASFSTTATYSDTYGTGLTLLSGTGNLNSDPLFIDSANANFGLRPTSPCIGTGTLL